MLKALTSFLYTPFFHLRTHNIAGIPKWIQLLTEAVQKQPLLFCGAQIKGWNRKLGEKMLTRQVGTEQIFSKQEREFLLVSCWRRVPHQVNDYLSGVFVLFCSLKRKVLSNEITFSWHGVFFGADEEEGDWQTIVKKSIEEYLLRRMYVSQCTIIW